MLGVRKDGAGGQAAFFAELRPFRDRLVALQVTLRPSGGDYLALESVKKALDAAAAHFTADQRFFEPAQEQHRRPIRARI